VRGKSGTRAAFVARRSDETCERRDAGASNARRRWEKKTAPNAFCCLTKSCNWFSFRRHQLSVLVVKSSGLRTERRWERPGARAERCSAHLDPRVSAACVTSRCPPPLIENLCARIDDEGTRTRGCVAGSGVTPRAVRPRRAHRVPSSRILRSVWVILGGAHRVLRSGEEQTDFREEKRTETTDTQLNSTHSTHSLTPLHSPRWLRRSEQSSSVFAR
jgi:hypothetical protein